MRFSSEIEYCDSEATKTAVLKTTGIFSAVPHLHIHYYRQTFGDDYCDGVLDMLFTGKQLHFEWEIRHLKSVLKNDEIAIFEAASLARFTSTVYGLINHISTFQF